MMNWLERNRGKPLCGIHVTEGEESQANKK